MSDIVADARHWLADCSRGWRLQTHSGNCHQRHNACLVRKLIGEIERLRTLAEQATPSEGSVQDSCTLTDAERLSLEFVVETGRVATHDAANLRSLLERLK